MQDDKKLLDLSAHSYNEILAGWNDLYFRKSMYLYEIFKPFFRGNNVLEVGCGDGIMTRRLLEDFKNVTVLDGSMFFIEQAQKNLPKSVRFIYTLVEDYQTNELYDIIVVAHVLEHLNDPITALKKIKEALLPDGRLLLAVPNANSLHRHVGVKMKMLDSIYSLNEQDKALCHKRIYDPKLFREHILESGLKIEKFGGYMVKPLSNRQIESAWSEELIQAFFDISDTFPDICSEIYAIAYK